MTEKRKSVTIEFDIVEKEDGSLMVDLNKLNKNALEARLMACTLMASDMMRYMKNAETRETAERFHNTFTHLGMYLQKIEGDYFLGDQINDIKNNLRDSGGGED